MLLEKPIPSFVQSICSDKERKRVKSIKRRKEMEEDPDSIIIYAPYEDQFM